MTGQEQAAPRGALRPRADAGPAPAAPSLWLDTWRRLRRSGPGLAGLAVVFAVALIAVLAPTLAVADPIAMDTLQRLKPPLTEGHLLGTDEFGRDILSRLVWGARTSLMAGLLAALGSLLVGGLIGLAAGYLRGRTDMVLMRLMDVLLAFPYILLAIAVASALGPGLRNAMLAVALVGVPTYARIVRASVLTVSEKEYVAAGRALGATPLGMIGRHVLPNVLAPILVMVTLDVGNKIIATASLSFLGLGLQPPEADWGAMLATGRNYVAVAPHVATLPGAAIFVTVLGLNLFGDALRDALDPYLK